MAAMNEPADAAALVLQVLRADSGAVDLGQRRAGGRVPGRHRIAVDRRRAASELATFLHH